MNIFVDAQNQFDNLSSSDVAGKQTIQPTVVLSGRSWNERSPFRLDGTKMRHVIGAKHATVFAHLTKPEKEWIKNIEIVNLGPEEIYIGALATELAAGTSVTLRFDGSEWSEVSRDLYINKGDFE